MSEEATQEDIVLTLQIPVRKEEPGGQSVDQLVKKTDGTDSATTDSATMETEDSKQLSIRKRRNLSKNRGQAARQREKTPEPSRARIPHEDTPTSDDEEDNSVPQSPREAEADDTYEEMKRLVQEQTKSKDPVYDLDMNEILEARAMAQTDRRRRSISPFAIPDKDKEEICMLSRKGSFIDPTNKLLSTNYILSPKDEDSRRGSLVIDTTKEHKHSLSTPSTTTASPMDKEFPFPLPATPKKQEQIVYPDEKKPEVVSKKPKSPLKKEDVFKFDEKDTNKPITKVNTLKTPETPNIPGELVTKLIQVERSPSRKLIQEKKPVVEVRERVVRTPSKKTAIEAKSTVVKRQIKEEPQSKAVPPVKPARSKSASRIGSKTSESEMSEDQTKHNAEVGRRKVIPTPRRFLKNKSDKAIRSQSVQRSETVTVVDRVDKTGTGMSQTSREILELMQKARARSLSIPKDDPRLPMAYKKQPPPNKNKHRELKTPNKTPNTLRQTRGISCPKTIQIISDKEILSGLNKKLKPELDYKKHSRQSSGYIDASQSEYTSSCYSSSPSENEYEFDLSERTAELTRKLNILSQEADNRELMNNNILLSPEPTHAIKTEPEKSVLRKRSLLSSKGVTKKETKELKEEKTKVRDKDKKREFTRSRWKLIANLQLFKQENRVQYQQIIMYGNRCICDSLLLIIMCGFGGMMFRALEGSFENAFKCSSRNVKRDFIESLWRGSHYLREEDWKSMARKKLFEFENQLHTAHEAGVTSYSGQRSWNFMNSFVYCMTLLTTIGYGHIAPKTTSGRVATIVYAIIGIPLFLIVLADFGKFFTRIIKFFWAFIRRFYYTRSCRKVRRTVPVQEVMKGLSVVYDVVRRPSQIFSEEDQEAANVAPAVERKPSDAPPPLPPKPGHLRDFENETEPETPAPSLFEIDDEFNLPISVAIVILVVYIVIGALGFTIWENWNFFESFYFVFISMSTIGLGDFVPDHPMFMMASILYLIFGLALTSMCINVVQAKLSNTFKQASAKLGATIGLKVAEEDGSLVPTTPPPTEIVPVHQPKAEIIREIEDKPKETPKEEIVKEIDDKSRETNDNNSKNR